MKDGLAASYKFLGRAGCLPEAGSVVRQLEDLVEQRDRVLLERLRYLEIFDEPDRARVRLVFRNERLRAAETLGQVDLAQTCGMTRLRQNLDDPGIYARVRCGGRHDDPLALIV